MLAPGFQLEGVGRAECRGGGGAEFRDVGLLPENRALPRGLDIEPLVLGFLADEILPGRGAVEDQFDRALGRQGRR
jgi:hypothetical protein